MKPLLSISIPTYNREPFLDKALENITAQLTPEVEIAISDDGSKDGTEAVAKKWQAKFPSQIVYCKKPRNERFDKNLVTATEKSSGKYVWFMSDDDMLNPGAVARVLSEIKKKEAAGSQAFLLLNYSRYDNATQSVTFERMMEFGDREFTPDQFMSLKAPKSYFDYLGMNIIYMSVFVFPRELWLKHVECCKKFIGTNFIHCFVFIHILAEERLSITYIGEPYVLYRSGNIRDWGTNVWKDFHTKFLNEVISLGIAKGAARKMKLRYGARKAVVSIGGKAKKTLRALRILPQKKQ